MKRITTLLILTFSVSILSLSAQDVPVLKITKKRKDPNNNELLIGLKSGSMDTNFDGARNQTAIHDQGLDEFDRHGIPGYHLLFGGGGYQASGLRRGVNYKPVFISAYMAIPIHKNLHLIPDLTFRKFTSFLSDQDATLEDVNTGSIVSYDYESFYEYTQLETTLKISAHTNWKIVNPYISLGAGPVFNLQNNRVIASTAIAGDPSFRKIIAEKGFPVSPTRYRNQSTIPVSLALLVNPGLRFKLSHAFIIIADFQYTLIKGTNVAVHYVNAGKITSNVGSYSLNLGLEYNLRKKL